MDDISILGRSGVLVERISEYLSSRIRQIAFSIRAVSKLSRPSTL